MKTLEIGKIGEKASAKFLRKNRYKIIKKNLHISRYEIDIIAEDKEYIVFVEVKTRSVKDDTDYGFFIPAGAVTKQKRQRTLTAARAFLSKYKIPAF